MQIYINPAIPPFILISCLSFSPSYLLLLLLSLSSTKMVVARIISRIPRSISAHCRTSLFLSPSHHHHSSILSHRFDSLHHSPNKIRSEVSLLHHSAFISSTFERSRGMSSSSIENQSGSKESIENQSGSKEHASSNTAHDINGASSTNLKASDGMTINLKFHTNQTEEAAHLSMDKVLKELEVLKRKMEEIEKTQDGVLSRDNYIRFIACFLLGICMSRLLRLNSWFSTW